jgi:hypothetical protein
METRLSFDGKGVNDCDEYRSRIATFTSDEKAQKFGELFAAAPELLDVLALALPYVECCENDEAYKPGAVAKMVHKMRAAIAKAEPTT